MSSSLDTLIFRSFRFKDRFNGVTRTILYSSSNDSNVKYYMQEALYDPRVETITFDFQKGCRNLKIVCRQKYEGSWEFDNVMDLCPEELEELQNVFLFYVGGPLPSYDPRDLEEDW